MKIHKGKPRLLSNFMFFKKYKNRKIVMKEAYKLFDEYKVPYIKKCGKIGDKFPYEIWVRKRFLSDFRY